MIGHLFYIFGNIVSLQQIFWLLKAVLLMFQLRQISRKCICSLGSRVQLGSRKACQIPCTKN